MGYFGRALTELCDMPHDDLDALRYVRDQAAQAGQYRLADDLTDLIKSPTEDYDALCLVRDQCIQSGI